MRETGSEGNDLLERLGADERLGLGQEGVAGAVADPLSFVGTALAQVEAFVAQVQPLVDADPAAAAYHPAPIL